MKRIAYIESSTAEMNTVVTTMSEIPQTVTFQCNELYKMSALGEQTLFCNCASISLQTAWWKHNISGNLGPRIPIPLNNQSRHLQSIYERARSMVSKAS